MKRKDKFGRVWERCEGDGSWSNGNHVIGCGRDNKSFWQVWAGPCKSFQEFKTLSEAVEWCAPTEPAATEPAATEPAATEPAATEPAATEPAATEPAAMFVVMILGSDGKWRYSVENTMRDCVALTMGLSTSWSITSADGLGLRASVSNDLLADCATIDHGDKTLVSKYKQARRTLLHKWRSGGRASLFGQELDFADSFWVFTARTLRAA